MRSVVLLVIYELHIEIIIILLNKIFIDLKKKFFLFAIWFIMNSFQLDSQ